MTDPETGKKRNGQVIQIGVLQANQRLDKFLMKRFPNAPKSLIYKFLRTKTIKLNGAKAAGNEILREGDEVTLFLSEETVKGFTLTAKPPSSRGGSRAAAGGSLDIVFEDENVLILNKPAGLLTQKDSGGSDSLNDRVLAYLQAKGEIQPDFTPGCVNRLDRNTSGLVVAAKNLPSAQWLSEVFRDRTCEKIYWAVVLGNAPKLVLTDKLLKDAATNSVSVSDDGKESRTVAEPWKKGEIPGVGAVSLLRVRLETGRSHQIRAHLAAAGYPVLGDPKYGDPQINRILERDFDAKSQLLHAYSLKFTRNDGFLGYLAEKTFEAEPVAILSTICNTNKEGLNG